MRICVYVFDAVRLLHHLTKPMRSRLICSAEFYNTLCLLHVCICFSLLDLLADRKDKAGKSGEVLINGHKRQTNFKTAVGYVVQVSLN